MRYYPTCWVKIINWKKAILLYKNWVCYWSITEDQLATKDNNFKWMIIDLFKWIVLNSDQVKFFEFLNNKYKYDRNLIKLIKKLNYSNRSITYSKLIYKYKINLYWLNIKLYDLLNNMSFYPSKLTLSSLWINKNISSIDKKMIAYDFIFSVLRQYKNSNFKYLIYFQDSYDSNDITHKNFYNFWVRMFILKDNYDYTIKKFKEKLDKIMKQVNNIKLKDFETKNLNLKWLANLQWVSINNMKKIMKIYKWITENINYNYDYLNKAKIWKVSEIEKYINWSWIWTLLNKKWVCGWISQLMEYMLNYDNINNSETVLWKWCNWNSCVRHAWVKINNLYYDPTWEIWWLIIKDNLRKEIKNKFWFLRKVIFWNTNYFAVPFEQFSINHVPNYYEDDYNKFIKLSFVKNNFDLYNYISKKDSFSVNATIPYNKVIYNNKDMYDNLNNYYQKTKNSTFIVTTILNNLKSYEKFLPNYKTLIEKIKRNNFSYNSYNYWIINTIKSIVWIFWIWDIDYLIWWKTNLLKLYKWKNIINNLRWIYLISSKEKNIYNPLLSLYIFLWSNYYKLWNLQKELMFLFNTNWWNTITLIKKRQNY